MNIKKAIIVTTICFALSTSTAFAHVTANPKTAEPGYGVATIRVPNEKDNPTVGLRVVVPSGVVVNAVKPVPGWSVAFTRASTTTTPSDDAKDDHEDEEENSEPITEITWTGGLINAGEFEEFPLSIQYTRTGDVVWKTYQTYADGQTVNWDGGKDSGHPASIVSVAEKTDATAMRPSSQVVPQNQWLSILALLTALAALFVSLRKSR